MRLRISGFALLCAGVLSFTAWLSCCPAAIGQEMAGDVAAAERYLQAALRAEIRGQEDRRRELLKRSLRAAPDHAPTRWQLGEVRIDDAWHLAEHVRQELTADGRLLRYRELRDQYAGSVDGEEWLARWCRSQDLDAEARAHWLQVLQLEPDNEYAARALGMRWFHGAWLTYAQIDALNAQARQAARDMRRWRPTLLGWRRDIEAGDAEACEAAMTALHALRDPSAAGALEEVFSDERRDRRSRELSLEAVAALDRMDDPAATASLVRHCVLSSWEDVRTAAADALATRPPHAYVPELLAGMESPIEATPYLYTYANFITVITFSGITLYQEGASEDQSLGLGASVRLTLSQQARDYAELARARNNLARAARGAARDMDAAQARLATEMETANARIRAVNARIQAALTRATGVDLDAEPRLWWQWWSDYNELYTPPDKPVRHRQYLAYIERPVGIRSSCFDRGTPVWTLSGRTPIEQVKVGDRVLSQDTQTGQLDYKPVIATTVRPPSELTAIKIGDDRISATRGHPLWVTGRGWRMVKNLTTQMSLHGVSGSLPIEGLASDGRREAFNLVVADFNTYFVGKHGLLAHDNMLRTATSAPLPGFPVHAVANND